MLGYLKQEMMTQLRFQVRGLAKNLPVGGLEVRERICRRLTLLVKPGQSPVQAESNLFQQLGSG
jgi:hypothetical protein